MSGSLIFVSFLGLFSLFSCLVQLSVLSYILFVNYLLEALSFLMRNRKGVDPDKKGSREVLGGVEEKTVTRISCMKNQSIFNEMAAKKRKKLAFISGYSSGLYTCFRNVLSEKCSLTFFQSLWEQC